MRKFPLLILILSFCFCTITVFPVSSQTLQPLSHPNHYILLIDSSGSMVSSQAKKTAFERALTQDLLQKLFQEGFGDSVPPYVPANDYLTLHYFGIVTGGEDATAYSRLADYDLLTQFIHPAFVRKKEITPDILRARIYPVQFYQYTIMSWARELALNQSGPDPSNNISQRTFLIMVHDGRPNENSLAEEVEMVSRFNKAGYDKALPEVSTIDDNYRFTDGHGNPKPAWAEQVSYASDGRSPIFVEAYEVNSASQLKWAAGVTQLQPLEAIEIQWQKDTGNAPEGMLTATLSKDFVDWTRQAKFSSQSLSVEVDGQKTSQPSLAVPFVVPSGLSCSARPFKTELRVSLSQGDKLLGQRTLNYTYPQTVTAPLPLRCTLTFIISKALVIILIVLVMAALAYYIYYRFYATHLQIQIPGILMPILLRRNVQLVAPAKLVPQRELEALSLKLPSLLKQYLFYRGATITLAAKGGQGVHWANDGNEAKLRLPLSYEYVAAYWNKVPNKPSSITLNYQQGDQHLEVTLSYPSCAPEHFEGVQK